MESRLTGRPRKYPAGVVDRWTDVGGTTQQVIPFHPDLGCEAGGAHCLKCKLPQCVEDLKRVKKE